MSDHDEQVAHLPNLMTRDQVARELNVTTRTVDNLLKRSHIKSVKLGTRVRIPRSELVRLLESAS